MAQILGRNNVAIQPLILLPKIRQAARASFYSMSREMYEEKAFGSVTGMPCRLAPVPYRPLTKRITQFIYDNKKKINF